ncbi:DUF1942 domain-containing protein [Mycolicibacterium vaccae]|uniref:MPT63 family protein n=1 Tax=Mycolicibacterium vaccae TaxID=1810 RepID=UPI003CF5B981
MKIKPTWAAAAAAGAAALAFAGSPLAAADTDTVDVVGADVTVKRFGQPGELVNGAVVQHWTVTDLKPSADAIPYQPVGTLWEATATDEAVAGSAIPIISNLNARADNGETYRVLFGVATEQGVNPSPIAQGEKTSGKVYFDVTGEQPDSVVYSDGTSDLLVWVQPPPAPATASTGSSYPAPSTSGSAEGTAAETRPATEPVAEPASVTPAPGAPEAVPAGSSGTPLPEGSSGTPLPEGSSGTPLPEGSSGTPLPEGSSGTPLPETAATTVAPAPPA